jgi:hypothetical protein
MRYFTLIHNDNFIDILFVMYKRLLKLVAVIQICAGMTARQIAYATNISTNTFTGVASNLA